MSKPDFFIVGTMRGGTTALHSYLSQHPAAFMPANPRSRALDCWIRNPPGWIKTLYGITKPFFRARGINPSNRLGRNSQPAAEGAG